MTEEERWKRRYPDLLTPELMKEGLVYEAALLSLIPSHRKEREDVYVEIARWEQDTPYIRFARAGRPTPDYQSVPAHRYHAVVLSQGTIVPISIPPSQRLGKAPTASKVDRKWSPWTWETQLPKEEELQPPKQGRVPPRLAVEDLDGYDERPDPLEAMCVKDFLHALAKYRAWAGDPSLRAMSSRCGNKVSHTTFATALKKEDLPKLLVVQALIEGCGGGGEDVRRWSTAWRRLRMKGAENTTEDTHTSVRQIPRANVG